MVNKIKTIILLLSLCQNLFAESIPEFVNEYFQANKDNKRISCESIKKVTVKLDLKNTKDYLVNCSNGESFRVIREHLDLWLGKPADKWISHGFKCSDLAGSTIEGWQDPKDWKISRENCSAK